jgi:hypothetical protein
LGADFTYGRTCAPELYIDSVFGVPAPRAQSTSVYNHQRVFLKNNMPAGPALFPTAYRSSIIDHPSVIIIFIISVTRIIT